MTETGPSRERSADSYWLTRFDLKTQYDAIVVGSGPNGLAAAITLAKERLSVLLIEGRKELGGGVRSEELTLPGFVHDICSAIHPLVPKAPHPDRFESLPELRRSASRCRTPPPRKRSRQ